MSDNDNFTLKNSHEITRKLNLIFKKNSLITVSFDEGKLFFISTLLDIDTKKKKIHLDIAPDEKINEKLRAANNILFETKVAGIHVYFTLPKVSKQFFKKNTTFIFDFPTELIWLERRLFYRVKTPVQNTPTCQFTLKKSASNQSRLLTLLNFELYDISLTGFSFTVNPNTFDPDIFLGIQTIDDCTITLPEGNSFSLDVEIKNHHPLKASAPEKHQIIGLKFPTLTSAYEAQIQRYLFSIERSRI